MLVSLKKFSYSFLIFSYGFLLCLPISAWAFDNFDCMGSAPDWKLSIMEQKFIFKLHNAPVITMPSVKPKPAENMDMDHIRIFRTKLHSNDAIVIIQKQSCAADNSEEIFSYEGLFITNDKVFHGCCSKKLIISNQPTA